MLTRLVEEGAIATFKYPIDSGHANHTPRVRESETRVGTDEAAANGLERPIVTVALWMPELKTSGN